MPFARSTLLLLLCSFLFASAEIETRGFVFPSPSPSPSPSPTPSVSPSPFPVTNLPLYPFDGECMSIEAGSLFFCDNLVYDIFVPHGKTIWEVDSEAYSTYMSGSVSIGESCCLLPYKDYVCSTLFPRCDYNGLDAVPFHPCSNWVCGAILADGPTPCFICDSSVLEFSETCSCPNSNASWNSECNPAEAYPCLTSAADLLSPLLGVVFVALSSFILSL